MTEQIFGTLGVILFLAFLVEAMVEYIAGQVVDHVPALQAWRWLLVYVSLAVGVLCAFIYRLDLVALLAAYLKITIEPGILGITLTGLSIGRGANFIHQIVAQYFPQK
jgi:TRAP-type C4-dicarboxylate transport system permease small subunit